MDVQQWSQASSDSLGCEKPEHSEPKSLNTEDEMETRWVQLEETRTSEDREQQTQPKIRFMVSFKV